MKVQNFKSILVSLATVTTALLLGSVEGAKALSPVQLPDNFAISPMGDNSKVVDKFGDNNLNLPSKAHLYDKSDSRTHTLTGIRSSSGSYEVHLRANMNMCFSIAGGLKPFQPNGTIAEFSNNCNNVLNLNFMDDNTIRLGRNNNMCLTNQGNRKVNFNRLHFWACDGSPETKFFWYALGLAAPQEQPQAQPQPQQAQPQSQPQQVSQPPAQPTKSCPVKGTILGFTPYEKTESVIGARGWNRTLNGVGHAIFGLVKTNQARYANGNCGSDIGNYITYKTVSAQGTLNIFKAINAITLTAANSSNGTLMNILTPTDPGYTWDMEELHKYYSEGVPPITSSKFVWLRQTISSTKYNEINQQNYTKLTGCTDYNAVPLIDGSASGFCHCGDVAARMYGATTGNWIFNQDTVPNKIKDLINRSNGY